jgi:hypothetical protein
MEICSRLKVDVFLQKPFSIQQLNDVVGNISRDLSIIIIMIIIMGQISIMVIILFVHHYTTAIV